MRMKTFRTEVLDSHDLVVFAFMRPGSAHLHLLHSLGVFQGPADDADLVGRVFGFVGDRTDSFRQPTAVGIPEKTWKLVTKKVVLDITILEEFYANPLNKHKLFHATSKTGEQSLALPRILLHSPASFSCLRFFSPTVPRRLELRSSSTNLS